ncbi:cell wall-active antibiotics response protein LiaF [Evansella cellulosilytica]|uniref:Cell wall-active antibiotics response protein n=1 Tax=Evansella cellulosilytica (strain ATCC 21833 / DSM 2522 / FERM P-1141 / JCM 9156 / N-4) TaxID=649639 RepID=E6TXV7_EVAC2|nr:cell wall-active antibiotics response protein LiaF [Evansella cellulosilytica]ADU31170.1 cell wall-active antibiotics response protein [Evansella cellulosilytica DSM 2522]
MKNIFGLLILTIGLLFLLSNTGLIDTDVTSIFSTFWPILIVLIGLKMFFEGSIYFFQSLKRDNVSFSKAVWGALILAIGIILLGNNAEWFAYTLSDLWSWIWPLLIVYIGFKLIFNKRNDIIIDLNWDKGSTDHHHSDDVSIKKKNKEKKKQSEKHHAFIGDIQLGKHPFEIDGTNISMGIGSIEVDLTRAVLKEGENMIDIRSWIGSVEILVPRDMAVKAVADVRIGEVTLFDDTYSGTSRKATYTSPNFHDADKRVILYVNLNIGDVEVLTVD